MRFKSCAGLDYELNNFVVVELRCGKPEIAFQEKLAFMDTVKRVSDRFKMPKNLLPVTALPGQKTMLKSLRFREDSIREKDIPEAVRWQFKDIEEDVLVRHCITGRNVFGSWLVVAAAAPQKQIDALANKVFRFGFKEEPVIDLRVLALWRGVKYFRPENGDTAMIVLEESPSGARIVAGRDCLEFAREIVGNNIEFEIRRTITHYKQEFTNKADILVVGEDLPENVVAIGMAIYPFVKPGVDFLSGGKRSIALSKGTLPTKKNLLAIGGTALVWLAIVTGPWAVSSWWSVQATIMENRMVSIRPALAQVDAIMKQTQTIQQWNAVLESFTPLPTTLKINDLRYALPDGCWLTVLETEGQQGQEAQNKQPAQQKPAGQNDVQQNTVTLPPAPSGFKIEGYSNSVNAIAAYRDNLSKLPWTMNPKVVSVAADETLGAYKFILSVGVKGGTVSNADTVRSDTGKPVS